MPKLVLTLVIAVSTLCLPGSGAVAQDAGWTEIEALFADRCVMCHSGDTPPKGLRLDSHEAALAGSENGPVLIAGDPDESELVKRIRGESEPRMPLRGDPLSEDEIAMIVQWVTDGMPGPAAQ